MTLFNFGKKKNKETNIDKNYISESKDGISSIKVLGTGCASCHALYENTQAAVKALNLPIEVEYITNLEKIMEYGVMSVPALVINEKVLSTGKVLKAEDIQKLLEKIQK